MLPLNIFGKHQHGSSCNTHSSSLSDTTKSLATSRTSLLDVFVHAARSVQASFMTVESLQLAFASSRDRHNSAGQTISLPYLIQQKHAYHPGLGQQANRQPQH
jgi:hypothetical protein